MSEEISSEFEQSQSKKMKPNDENSGNDLCSWFWAYFDAEYREGVTHDLSRLK
jgi:hypothetical protein